MRTVQVTGWAHRWYARIERPGVIDEHPAEFMERGPYPFKWMAKLAFPIQRWTW